jgi:hypothetical protein
MRVLTRCVMVDSWDERRLVEEAMAWLALSFEMHTNERTSKQTGGTIARSILIMEGKRRCRDELDLTYHKTLHITKVQSCMPYIHCLLYL